MGLFLKALPSHGNMEANRVKSVQVFGRKKTATAVAYCKAGRGLIKLNGTPIELVRPEILRFKVFEPVLLLGQDRFSMIDIRIRVKGGGYTSQIYAIRQAIAKAIVAYYQKYVDEAQKREIKAIFTNYGDKSVPVHVPSTRSRTVKWCGCVSFSKSGGADGPAAL